MHDDLNHMIVSHETHLYCIVVTVLDGRLWPANEKKDNQKNPSEIKMEPKEIKCLRRNCEQTTTDRILKDEIYDNFNLFNTIWSVSASKLVQMMD